MTRPDVAISRLRRWADPKSQGKPMDRLKMVWPHPILMAQDMNAILAWIDSLEQKP